MQLPASTFPSYDQYSNDVLLSAYEAGPRRLREVINGLTEEELRLRARGPSKWSIHEIVIHVSDSELQGVYRMRKAWSETGASLPGYNQDAWAVTIDYNRLAARVRDDALQLFSALRAVGLGLLSQADGGDWNRWGVHPDYGRVSFRDLLALYADHSERHIAQVLESRVLLGKPLTYELLLPTRLY